MNGAGGVLFAVAGFAFVWVCVAALAVGSVAHGVDVPVPDAQADETVDWAFVLWVLGLVVALGDFWLWRDRLRSGGRILPIAIIDLVVQLGVIVALVFVGR